MADSIDEEQEEFWADLIPLIMAQQVVPVVGADLLSVSAAGASVSFYRVVAERLLSRYGLQAPGANDGFILRRHHELNDAVCELDHQRKRTSADCYLPVHEALRATLAQTRGEIEAPLRQLAEIADFRHFVTTTCDDVLAQAVDAVRYGRRPQTRQIEYAPSGLPMDRSTDLEVQPPQDHSAVLYLFGKAAVSPVFAVHDEDVLEFLYGLRLSLSRLAEPLTDARRRTAALERAARPQGFRHRIQRQRRTGVRPFPQEFRAQYPVVRDGTATVRYRASATLANAASGAPRGV